MSLLKIGDIAKKTGLTVRALHHYDEIGLLTPSARSASGFRLYTRDDLEQLQKIKSLQQLGFALQEIAGVLKDKTQSLSLIVNKHLSILTQQVKEQQALIQRLQSLAIILEQGNEPSVEGLLETLKVTIMFEKYYTKEQLEQLAERKKSLGNETINHVQQEWQDLFDKFRQLYEKKESVSSTAVQELAKRALELIEVYTGGDHAIKQSLQKMYEQEGGANILNMDKEVFAYYRSAVDLAEKK